MSQPQTVSLSFHLLCHRLCHVFAAAMLFAVYALCMYALYSFMPVVVKLTSATAVNLSLLTADLFSLFCGLFLFHYKVSVITKSTMILY